MTKKILLLDVDGVVIRPRHKYFSEKLSEDYGIPLEAILPFFKSEYKKAAVGQNDIREILPSYLEKWGWSGSVDEFLDYWFESEKDVDQDVVELIRKARESGVKVFLASDNEARRAEYLMNEVGLKAITDGSFFSSTLGFTKSDSEFFTKIIEQLGCSPEEIEFWDDDPKNIEVANTLGINGNVYTNFEDLQDSLGY